MPADCTREQMQGLGRNRYYYQISIPLKDAAILSNCPDREMRRGWIKRIVDHDGYGRQAKAASRPGYGSATLSVLAREELTVAQARAARRALRRRRLRQLRAPRAVAGGGLFVADRVVRAGDPQGPPCRLAASIIPGSSRRASRISARASRWRNATSHTVSTLTLDHFEHARAAGARARDPEFKLDVSMVDARRHAKWPMDFPEASVPLSRPSRSGCAGNIGQVSLAVGAGAVRAWYCSIPEGMVKL